MTKLLTVGMDVKVETRKEAVLGTIVHIFQADVKPNPSEVVKYYGEKASVTAFRESRSYRVVIRKEDKDTHLIIPLTLRNKEGSVIQPREE